MPTPLTSKVLLIGWDAADWKVITPLLDAGKMPHLAQFLSQGVMGNLATLYPVLSPMLWTSIATGKRAYKHGIHGFSEPDPQTGGVRPISNLSRKTKAIWNILNQEGKRCNVVGWWPSEPVEPINGVMVSNHYQEAIGGPGKPWPMRRGTVHPERLIQDLKDLRIAPWELDGEQLLPFVPRATEIDQEKDRRLYSVAKILAECSSIHAAATAIMQLEPWDFMGVYWDFMGVYYDAIDHFGHGFMRYHPPRSPWISEQDFELYKDVVEGCYRFHDLMLGVLVKLAGEEATVIICSDHGFHPDRLRPQFIPNEPAGPAEEHRPFGVVAMKGPGIKQNDVIFGASLLDITPTVLTLFGLPLGKDMDGKPLVGAMAQPPELDFVDSWDQIPGDCAMHPDNARVDPVDAHEAMQQLVDLGYIDELDTDKEKAVANAVRELRYNLARDYIGANRPADAIPLLEDLWHQWPEENRFGLKLFNCHLSQNRTAQARTTLEQIIASKKQAATQAQAELKDLSEDLKDKPPEEITPDQHRRVRKLQARASVNLETFAFLWGSLLHVEGDYDGAVTELEKAKTAQMHNLPSLYLKIAEVYLAKGDWRQAEGHFSYVLELDPVNPAAHLGRCRSYLKQGHNPQALEEAMASIGLIYHDPQAHFFCGVALNRCDRPHDALKALQTTISQNPVFPAAHRYLARLYTRRFQDLEQATHHRKLAQESRQRILAYRQAGRPATVDTVATGIAWQITEASNRFPTAPLQDSVVIVSGLPRSGTSMMMQMLAAGGLPILTDQVRGADENNPKGYFELEKVKLLATDRDWIAQAQGQGVKVIAQLLPQLPQGYPYRIIFMQRHLSEVIASQTKMLQRLERKGGNLSPDKLAQTFIRQLDEVQQVLSHYENIGVLYLSYQMVLDDPSTAAAQVNQFLDGSLDPGAMVGAIVPSLHRERATVSP